jgi:CheY-like chemotaxis protein
MLIPGMDGREATRRAPRDLGPERQPRGIALTAAAFAENRGRRLEAGMEGYVWKPIDTDQLAAMAGKVACSRNGSAVPRNGV